MRPLKLSLPSILIIFHVVCCQNMSDVPINIQRKIVGTEPDVIKSWLLRPQNQTPVNISDLRDEWEATQAKIEQVSFNLVETRNVSADILKGRLPEEARIQLRHARDALRGVNERVREAVESLIQGLNVRVEELRMKVSCIRQRGSEAREEVQQGLLEVGKCVVKAGQSAATSIQPVIKDLEEHAIALADVAGKVALGLLECRKAEQPTVCVKEVLLAANKALIPISENVKTCLLEARNCWKQFVEDLKICFISGAEQAIVIDKEFRLEALECIAPRTAPVSITPKGTVVVAKANWGV